MKTYSFTSPLNSRASGLGISVSKRPTSFFARTRNCAPSFWFLEPGDTSVDVRLQRGTPYATLICKKLDHPVTGLPKLGQQFLGLAKTVRLDLPDLLVV